jgi:hypothetical protein
MFKRIMEFAKQGKERTHSILTKISKIGVYNTNKESKMIIDLLSDMCKDYIELLDIILEEGDECMKQNKIDIDTTKVENTISELKSKAMESHEYNELFNIFTDMLELTCTLCCAISTNNDKIEMLSTKKKVTPCIFEVGETVRVEPTRSQGDSSEAVIEEILNNLIKLDNGGIFSTKEPYEALAAPFAYKLEKIKKDDKI